MAEGSESKQTSITTPDEMVVGLATDYAEFAESANASAERQRFTEMTDDLLIKLDEFVGLADLVRSDVNLTLNSTLGAIHAKSRAMESQFDRIDALQAFVTTVRRNLDELEAAVENAETELGATNVIRKAIGSFSLPAFLSSKSGSSSSSSAAPKKAAVRLEYRRVEIFNTSDYILPSKDDWQVSQSTTGLGVFAADVANTS